MNRARIAIGCVLLLLVASGLWAQTSAVFDGYVDGVVNGTRFSLGPIRFHPDFVFATFSWVSSIFGFSNTLSNLSDLVIAPAPSLTASLLFRRSLILSFTDTLQYNFYLTQSSYRGFTNGYKAEGKILLFDTFILSGQYANTQQRYLGYLELDRVVQGNSQTATVQLFGETARGTSLTLMASHAKLTFNDVAANGAQISAVLDHIENAASAEFAYRLFSLTQFFLRADYMEYTFGAQDASFRSSRAEDIMAGLRFSGTGSIRGSLSLGLKRFEPVNGNEPGFTGLVGNTSVQFRFENLGLLDVGFIRDNYFSLLQDFVFFLDSSFFARMTIRTTRFLFLRIGGQYDLLDYSQGSPLGVGPSSTFHDHYAGYQGGFLVRLAPHFGLGLTYQNWARNSRVLGQNFSGYLLSIDIVRDF